MTTDIRRIIVRAFLVSVCFNAAFGVWALVVEDFGDTQGRILATSFFVSAAMVSVLVNVPATQKRLLWPLPVVSGLVAAAAIALFTVLMWIGSDAEAWIKLGVSGLFVGGAGTLVGLMALLPLANSYRPVRLGHIVTTTALLATALYALWIDNPGSIMARVIGVEAVVVAALTLALPAVSRLTSVQPTSHQSDVEVRFCPYCGDAIVSRDSGESDQSCEPCGLQFRVTIT